MNKLIVKGGKLIFENRIEEGLAIVCDKESGKISSIVLEECLTFDEYDEVIDIHGKYASPGFVDIHVHGGGGYDFMDGTEEAFLGAAKMHASHGTTAMYPTTLTCSDEELLRTFDVFKRASKINDSGAHLMGLHLEGPYFNPDFAGAQDPAYLKNPVPSNYMPILNAPGADCIKRWSVAPELEGAVEFGRELESRGILASIGHSGAIYEEVETACKNGYSHFTHLYCAMSSITRRNAFRKAGVLEAAYLLDDTTVEIIADGVHLPAPLLTFVFKFKGVDRIALCTDSMRAAGMPDGTYLLGSNDKGQPVIVEDGVAKLPDRSAFAGSVATTDRLVRTMMHMAEVSMIDAVKMASLVPARIMKIDGCKGSLMVGKDADIIVFDKDINIEYTIVSSKLIYSSK